LELGILVKLLTQQSAAPSTTREEIKEDPFVLALGLGHGLIERSLEPILGRGEGGDEKYEREEGECFLHGHLRVTNIGGLKRIVNRCIGIGLSNAKLTEIGDRTSFSGFPARERIVKKGKMIYCHQLVILLKIYRHM
jgi:hypothetical protein